MQRPLLISPLSGALGAEITGPDLSHPLSDTNVAEIRAAFVEHLVIFFRDQVLTPESHKAFGRCFGELNIDRFVKGPAGHPEIMPVIKEADDHRNFAGMWHSDVSFQEEPAMGSILYAREVPPVGGDTLFANMYLAFETLSSGMKETLKGLRAVHCAAVTYDRKRMDEANRLPGESGMRYSERDPEAEQSLHPVVRKHPESGRLGLYVNCAFTRRFEGMTEEESKPLLTFLYRHLSRPEFTCRFRWAKGSIAFWDNRCAQHLPVNDYQGHRREMHRVTVCGDKPY